MISKVLIASDSFRDVGGIKIFCTPNKPVLCADARDRTCNDHAIKAGKRSPYFACMTISEKFRLLSPQNKNIFEETCSHMAKAA
jgi:hypothetical protein